MKWAIPCIVNRKIAIIYPSYFMNMICLSDSFSHICTHTIALKLCQLFYPSCFDFYKYKNQTLYMRVVGTECIKIFLKICGGRASATSFLSIKPCIIQYKYLYYIEDSYCQLDPSGSQLQQSCYRKIKIYP